MPTTLPFLSIDVQFIGITLENMSETNAILAHITYETEHGKFLMRCFLQNQFMIET